MELSVALSACRIYKERRRDLCRADGYLSVSMAHAISLHGYRYVLGSESEMEAPPPSRSLVLFFSLSRLSLSPRRVSRAFISCLRIFPSALLLCVSSVRLDLLGGHLRGRSGKHDVFDRESETLGLRGSASSPPPSAFPSPAPRHHHRGVEFSLREERAEEQQTHVEIWEMHARARAHGHLTNALRR